MNRNLLIIPLALLVFASCGTKSESTTTEDYGEPAASASAQPQADIISQGQTLVKNSDCNTCHHVTSQIVGPSHTDVAKKYDFTMENVEMIADRIIKGSSGVWGQVMMNPHPALSKEDAEKMAYYVLSLDGEKEPN